MLSPNSARKAYRTTIVCGTTREYNAVQKNILLLSLQQTSRRAGRRHRLCVSTRHNTALAEGGGGGVDAATT